MKKVLFLLALVVLSSSILLPADEGHHHDYDPNEKLGTVSFPVSCSPDLQKAMERGVALLHSFWYEEAEKQFADLAGRDPKCAMAYWGQAMAQFHQLWERVEPAQLKTGRQFLDQANSAHPNTKREKEYIAALDAFYRLPDNTDYQKRLDAYSAGMKKVYEDNPNDHEAAAFYALSLIAAQREEDATQARTKEAVAILKPLFDAEPDHPGIAHYLIHACDTPQLAPEALAAARKYASIAPSSAHAVHMPSHIFARLGLWQEDIQSNLASIAAGKKATAMHMGGGAHALHAMDFLEYAYLQIGDDVKAKAIVDEMQTFTLDEHDAMARYLSMARAVFPANYALETRDWKAAAGLTPPAASEPHDRSITYWAQAIGAGHLKDKAAAEEAVQHLNEMIATVRKGTGRYAAEYMEKNDRPEATAWMDYAGGKDEEALKLLRTVADRQDAVGKGEVEIPAREMLGDMLLELHRPEEALVEYERSLKTDPNRFNGLYGAGRAAELTHQQEKANGYYTQLLKNCTGDSDRPELARVRTMLAAK